jgi:hypothetical protein|tara:strand:+ start:363 stop:659 length:297 start_codon:yes stop_codon:yes gene_type:complete
MSDELSPYLHHSTDDTVTISHSQDVSGILEQNRLDRIAAENVPMGDTQKVASIPSVIVIEWMKEGINVMAPNREDLKRIKKKLNSPEWAYLRTGGGRL